MKENMFLVIVLFIQAKVTEDVARSGREKFKKIKPSNINVVKLK